MRTATEVAARKKPKVFKTDRGVKRRVPNCLLELRNSLGLTTRDVAKATGINNSVICRAEHGMEVWISTALKFAKFFEKPVEQIWKNGATA